MYTLSKIYNLPILLLVEKELLGQKLYKKLMVYNNSTNKEYEINDIICLLFVNNNHYNYMETNVRYIKGLFSIKPKNNKL